MAQYALILFVTGSTPASERALANLRALCDEFLDASEYELEIVDVLQHPERAESEGILLTPTLIKREPPPARRLIGDLSDRRLVVSGLALDPRPTEGNRT